MFSIIPHKMPGLHVDHHKNTQDRVPVRMPPPQTVHIPMSMHVGAPCAPTVAVGDHVKVGQVIGNSEAFVSAPIHASVSGDVVAMQDITYLNGARTTTIVIDSDGLMEVDASIAPPVIENRADFVKAVRASGCVGLGGAGFPTHVKFAPKNIDEIDTLIVNAAECEPYITSDFRTMMDRSDDVLEGIGAIMKYLGLQSCKIGIEANKPEAIAKMTALTKDNPSIDVVSMAAAYPRGAEKVLIFETTGRVLPEKKLPADVNVIVSNITTIAFLARFLKTGMPLVEKTLTVDGSAVAEPKNVIVPIGTPFSDLIAFCGGYKQEPKLMLMGGPMMGTSIYSDAYPVLKQNNALLAFGEAEANLPKETPCLKCGRCIKACPYSLMPVYIERAYKRGDAVDLEKLKVTMCIECGCCSYACPAKRQLSLTNKLAKQMVMKAAKK